MNYPITGTIRPDLIYDWEKDYDYKKCKKILFQINSHGGCLFTSTNILSRMLKEKKRIVTQCFGLAESGATIVFLGGEERIATKGDRFLIHCGRIRGKIVFNRLKRLSKSLTEDEKDSALKNNVNYKIICERLDEISNKDFDYWMNIIKDGKDHSFNGEDFYKLGIVTKLIG